MENKETVIAVFFTLILKYIPRCLETNRAESLELQFRGIAQWKSDEAKL